MLIFSEAKSALVNILLFFACLRPNPLVRCSPFLFPLFKCHADSAVGTRVVNNCTILLCSLGVGIVDDQSRGRRLYYSETSDFDC